MQFSVEKRTREVINQRLEVFQPVKLVSSAELIEETANPPAWLRQKDLGEELKSSVKIESKLNEAPFSVQPAAKQESQQMNIPTIRKEQQPEAKIEPLISSTRQIVFSSNTITNPLEAPKTGMKRQTAQLISFPSFVIREEGRYQRPLFREERQHKGRIQKDARHS